MQDTPLPEGAAPTPVPLPHFPDRLHAFVWRNWQLVPLERIARTVGATPAQIRAIGAELGLGRPPRITDEQLSRSHLTILRRNWHLLPYPQLLKLLDITAQQLAFTLQEDDFLYIKLGSLKPRCEPLRWREPDPAATERARLLARQVREVLGEPALLPPDEPLFGFLPALTAPPKGRQRAQPPSRFAPRFCYPYFALYGDPLLGDPQKLLPDGYLERMAQAGADGIWLQGLLTRLSPFPWEPARSDGFERRRATLRALAERARRHGIGIHLYLNEPRSLPLGFFARRPALRGVAEGDHAALCTGAPAVRRYLVEAVESLLRETPELAGVFTISGSENLTSCWSHGRGAECPRCGPRGAADIIADVNRAIGEGIERAGTGARFFAWDWGWPDDAAPAIIEKLPDNAALMSVSEWSLPIERGGVRSAVGEYSLSAVGPGPRATRHWELARRRGLKTIAKIQAAVTWELGAVPYIPAVALAARHAANLRRTRVDGLMLGWTLGGWPSPNLEAVAALGGETDDPEAALAQVARRRFGPRAAGGAVDAWKEMSAAFEQFPYHIETVYHAPLYAGPSNLLWEKTTGYTATMVGLAYDDLERWRAVYPPDVFARQLETVADGFERGARRLRALSGTETPAFRKALAAEADVAEACALHFGSVAAQARFVLARAAGDRAALRRLLDDELERARRLYVLQRRDSRIGFEASNQYYYVPVDLLEKIVNVLDLRDRWLPALP